MKKNLFQLLITIATVILLIVVIEGCNNNSSNDNLTSKAELDSAHIYDSNSDREGTVVWVCGDSVRTAIVVWSNCPPKENSFLTVVEKPKTKKDKTTIRKKENDRSIGPSHEEKKDSSVVYEKIIKEEGVDTIIENSKDTVIKKLTIINQNNQWYYFNQSDQSLIKDKPKRSIFWPAAMTVVGASGLLFNGAIITNVFKSDKNFPDKAPKLIFRDKTRNTGVDVVSGIAFGTGLYFLTRNIILNYKDRKTDEGRINTSITADGLTIGLNLNKKNK